GTDAHRPAGAGADARRAHRRTSRTRVGRRHRTSCKRKLLSSKERSGMIGIIPAAGAGQRIQPLGCSKELLPVGSRLVDGVERPKAVSEYLVERMIAAGADQICMVISAEKTDIIEYYAARDYAAEIFYVVQQTPRGLCDALFRAEPFARHHERVLIGLPDTIWFPENAYLPALASREADCNLVLFPVDDPSLFDAVICDDLGFVEEVQVKKQNARSNWIW